MNVRIDEFAAMVMIGDGVLAAVMPESHVTRWMQGPPGWQRAMCGFAEHPTLTRALGVAEAALGVWWAARLPTRSA